MLENVVDLFAGLLLPEVKFEFGFAMSRYPIRHEKNERSGKYLEDGKLALGVTVGALAILLLFSFFDFGAVEREENVLELAPLLISLFVAFASTFLAFKALLEQRKAREAGTDPVLVAHLGQRDDARELITFNVSNVGAGAALNVLLDVQISAEELIGRDLVTNVFKRHHPFSVILQGNSIEFSLAVGWELLGDRPLPPFIAKISYEDLEGGMYESQFTVDVREMEGLGANKSPQMRMVSALEVLAAAVKER